MKKFIIKHKKFRIIRKDFIYNSELVTVFINFVMLNGKKNKAELIVYKVLENLKKKKKFSNNDEVVFFLEKIIQDCNPKIRITTIKRGGGIYKVPITLNFSKSTKITLKLLIKNARIRKTEKTIINKLTQEILDSSHKHSKTFKKKTEILELARKNKAFTNIF